MKLEELQQELSRQGIQALLVTMNNMFIGQDITAEENKILHLTGFSGSAGTLLVMPDKAWLLVDSRYSIQARRQVDPAQVEVVDFTAAPVFEICRLCRENQITELAFDPWCVSLKDYEYLQSRLEQVKLRPMENLTGELLSSCPVEIFEHDLAFAGRSCEEKIKSCLQNLPAEYDAQLLTAADQVSWLINERSFTLPDTPIVRSWALLDRNGKLTLYGEHIPGGRFKPFAELGTDLQAYAGKTLLIDPATTPRKIAEFLPSGIIVKKLSLNPVADVKLRKNETELNGFKNCHLRDGVAVVKFLSWLEQNKEGKSEWDIVQKLREFRSRQKLFFSDSFGTIAAVGANAAVVHYQPTAENHASLAGQAILLLDSGAQYYDGTTDVTRTVALDQPSVEMKHDFTLVLKAHIALASAVFPVGCKGSALDALARAPLWQAEKNYGHGTGHGVGHFSNVHESPFSISPLSVQSIYRNYVTSIEPGFYKEGCYGIRIENLAYAAPAETEGFLKFVPLTLIPIDKRLIDPYLLNRGEQDWLNNYHQMVCRCLAPYLDSKEKAWLESACSPL